MKQRPIDLDNTISELEGLADGSFVMTVEQIKFFLGQQPNIDPLKQGHWNLVSRQNIWDDLVDVYECSECKKYTTNGRGNTSPTDYCPNCGARMDGEKSSRD